MSGHPMTSTLRDVFERLAPCLGNARPVSWRRPNGGYGGAEHWILLLDDGRSCFIKAATDLSSAQGLRTEYQVYSRVRASFLPQLLWWDDDAERPFLVLEDLSDAFWPPPWDNQKVDQVLAMLNELHATPAPGLRLVERSDKGWRGGELVATAPGPFLSLGLCSEGWLSASLNTLLAAALSVTWEPTHFIHSDVRSDNICFQDGRPLLIDWSLAGRGSPLIDLLGWLPSLHAEGGPPPEALLPEAIHESAGGWAALYSGYFAAHAGLVVIPEGSDMRNLQLEQLTTALPWAVRALGLPPLDGTLPDPLSGGKSLPAGRQGLG